ncbi:MAG: oxidoreductase [Bacillota bacterium]
MPKTVLLLGATGLVGQECLKLLRDDNYYSRIIALTRKPVSDDLVNDRIENQVINYDRLDDYKDYFKVDHIICALGSTMAQAGSRDNFYKVDFTYPYEAAKIGLNSGAEHFLLVSALGADEHSRVFYNRVKGELELGLKKLGYKSLSIFRPSLLLGKRREFRLGEEAGKVISNIFSFAIPPKYKPVEATDLAMAIVKISKTNYPGIRIVESDAIRSIARN